MSIRFSCSCGRKLKVSDEKIGMKVLCSSCGATLKVPKKSQDEYWQEAPAKGDQPKVDYVATFREIVTQIRSRRRRDHPRGVGRLLSLFTDRCRSRQSASLGGRLRNVKLDGKPLANATVRFIPLDDSGRMDRKGASAAWASPMRVAITG